MSPFCQAGSNAPKIKLWQSLQLLMPSPPQGTLSGDFNWLGPRLLLRPAPLRPWMVRKLSGGLGRHTLQSESAVQMLCARGGCSWAGRACGVGQMHANLHAGGVGCKCEALCMGGVVQGWLRYLIRYPAPGRRRRLLRAANQPVETCAHTASMSGMVICMKGMQQIACQ